MKDIGLNSITEYFGKRMAGIALFHKIIKGLSVIPEITESYGSDYCRTYFSIDIAPKDFNSLSAEEQSKAHYHFADSASISGCEFVSHIIYQAGKDWDGPLGYDGRLRRLKEFYDCYNSLSRTLVEYCFGLLDKSAKIDVRSLDGIPEFVYVQRYWEAHDFSADDYKWTYRIRFDEDVSNHWPLLKSASQHAAFAKSHPQQFLLSDKDIVASGGASLADMRWFIIHSDIPIRIEGTQVVESIWIDVHALTEALDLRTADAESTSPYHQINVERLQLLIASAIELHEARLEMIPQRRRKATVAVNDIVLTKRGRLITVEQINDKAAQAIFIGREIDKTLKVGRRRVSIEEEDVQKSVSLARFNQLKDKYSWKLKEQAVRWLQKNRP